MPASSCLPDRVLIHYDVTAPVLTEVGVKYAWKTFNGTFMKENIYRQAGSPEVDTAWEALGVDCEPCSPC
jgi:hypothetical protein